MSLLDRCRSLLFLPELVPDSPDGAPGATWFSVEVVHMRDSRRSLVISATEVLLLPGRAVQWHVLVFDDRLDATHDQ
jgi:hypothetical protein